MKKFFILIYLLLFVQLFCFDLYATFKPYQIVNCEAPNVPFLKYDRECLTFFPQFFAPDIQPVIRIDQYFKNDINEEIFIHLAQLGWLRFTEQKIFKKFIDFYANPKSLNYPLVLVRDNKYKGVGLYILNRGELIPINYFEFFHFVKKSIFYRSHDPRIYDVDDNECLEYAV